MSAPENHPEFERLLQFKENQLSPIEAEAISRHLSGCHECARVVERIDRITRVLEARLWSRPPARGVDAAIHAFQQAGHIRRSPTSFLARLAFDSHTMALAPGLRAEATDTQQLLYTTDIADVDLSVSIRGEETRQVIGQVLPKSTSPSMGAAQVLLIRADQVAAQALATDLGEFVIDDVPLGEYTLVVLTPDVRLEISQVLL